jgi:acyl-CoA synthetase (AMP-forming)/AMP-acid ligase II
LLSERSFIDQEIAKGSSNDVAAMFFTSGTTGAAKGVVHTHGSLIGPSRTATELEKLGPDDVILAYLPPAWIGQNIFSCAQAYVAGYCICCPESAETVMTDMREVDPDGGRLEPEALALPAIYGGGESGRRRHPGRQVRLRRRSDPLCHRRPAGVWPAA